MTTGSFPTSFMKGMDLSQAFYEEAVKPILESHFPDLVYSAGRLGGGSDVLGFDTAQSMDHDWGPKFTVFLAKADHSNLKDKIDQVLRHELPTDVRGFPTNLGLHDDGSDVMVATEKGPVNHRVIILTVTDFFEDYLGLDVEADLSAVDWLTLPEQRLRSIVSGRVFHDGLGTLEPILARLQYYPRDVWFYLLSNQWRRISQEEAFMGRCGQVGDELGSRLIAGRLVHDLMKLCFLMKKQYAPYIKWFGSAFSQLDCAAALTPIFTRVLHAESWKEREKHLTSAYEYVARMHNELRITSPLNDRVSPFHKRPFMIIQGNDFADAILEQIDSDDVKSLPNHLGGIDQFVHSTDVLAYPNRYRKFTTVYK
ncbi:MAG: DUF4037 domain-containing protein [Candidatus Thorarchaeota archaeon SMTZ1-83]|nr:MAG: hypothetical protein AM324_16150 [Candidatus Thorarchaeota archaeon SMTZ1-83]